MKIIKRIFFLFSLFLLYIIARECIQLFFLLKNLHPILAYFFGIVLIFFFLYWIGFPLLQILKMPGNLAPVKNKKLEATLISKRLQRFRKNRYLSEIGFEFDVDEEEELYNRIILVLEKKVAELRKRHVSQMFYTTSIAQNGFLDALFILSGSINHIKDIFLLYNGRVSNRDLWIISKKIYYSMAIGGSESVEYAAREFFSKFATDSLKSIPFIDKILSSIADGLVNAALLTRISLITENYCKLTYIRSDRDLYPKTEIIISSARSITGDILERLMKTMRKMAIQKTLDFSLIAINPIGYVMEKSIDRLNSDSIDEEKKITLKEYARLLGNPLAFGLEKLYKSIRKRKYKGMYNEIHQSSQ